MREDAPLQDLFLNQNSFLFGSGPPQLQLVILQGILVPNFRPYFYIWQRGVAWSCFSKFGWFGRELAFPWLFSLALWALCHIRSLISLHYLVFLSRFGLFQLGRFFLNPHIVMLIFLDFPSSFGFFFLFSWVSFSLVDFPEIPSDILIVSFLLGL